MSDNLKDPPCMWCLRTYHIPKFPAFSIFPGFCGDECYIHFNKSKYKDHRKNQRKRQLEDEMERVYDVNRG